MATLDDAAFGAATQVTPKFVSPSDPAEATCGTLAKVGSTIVVLTSIRKFC